MQNKLKNTIRSQLAAVTAAEKQQPFLKLLPAGIIQPGNCNFRNPPAGQGKRLQALYIIQQPFPDYGPGEVAVVRDLSQRQDIGTDSVDRFVTPILPSRESVRRMVMTETCFSSAILFIDGSMAPAG